MTADVSLQSPAASFLEAALEGASGAFQGEAARAAATYGGDPGVLTPHCTQVPPLSGWDVNKEEASSAADMPLANAPLHEGTLV